MYNCGNGVWSWISGYKFSVARKSYTIFIVENIIVKIYVKLYNYIQEYIKKQAKLYEIF